MLERIIAEGEYETPEFEEDILPYLQDLTDDAHEALEARDFEQLNETLERLLDLRGELGNDKVWNEGIVDNWIGVLDQPGESEGDSNSAIENLVIQLVADLCTKLCRMIAQDRRALRQIEWRQLEQVIATALSGIGFNVTLTPSSKDGGKDVVANCIIAGEKLTFYIEIKHWRSSKRVNADPIFDFVEVNVGKKTAGGLFISTSGFTDDVYSHFSELCSQHVAIAGEAKVVSLCQHFTRRNKGIWYPASSLPDVLFGGTDPEFDPRQLRIR